MRYQGDQAASVEIEARWRFHGRWSVVGFAGAGTARSDERYPCAPDDGSSQQIHVYAPRHGTAHRQWQDAVTDWELKRYFEII